MSGPRLAVRAVIVREGRLLLVNAYPGNRSRLWCAPGGGVEKHQSVHDNLVREVREETGLEIVPGRLLAVSEFHDPPRGFHQVELFYRAEAVGDVTLDDPEGVVNRHVWATEAEVAELHVKPDVLRRIAFEEGEVLHDPLETIVE